MLERIKNFLNNPLLKVFGLSLTVTFLISSLFGLAWYLFTKQFWSGFIGGFCIQVIVFAIVNTILARKDTITSTKLFNEQLEALAKFSVNLTCSYCKQPAIVPIRLDQENRFKCEHCNQVNGVKMQFISTQITTPLERVVAPIEESVPLKSVLDS
jgi:hypothetical protein